MRWRLVAAFVGVLVLVLLAQDVPLASHLRSVENERVIAELQRDAFILAGTTQDVLAHHGPAGSSTTDLQSTTDVYRAGSGAGVVITDAAGIALAVSDNGAGDGPGVGEEYSNRPEIATAMQGTPTSGRRLSKTLGEDLVFVAVPVLSGTTVVGVVRIAYPASSIDERGDSKVRGLLLVGVISLTAAIVAALFMAGTVVRPLRRLQRATEQVAAGDFTGRADPREGPPEVRALATSFNAMTERIEGLVEQQRAFAGDASHQLRTPLTALRLQLERGAEMIDHDPDGARGHIEAAGQETERMQRLVEGLLLLARSEHASPVREDVDVTAVASERAQLWQPLAAERGVELVARTSTVARAHLVAGALEQILDNFLDNAISVSPPGSTVEMVVELEGDATVLHVLDRGPGMTDSQLEHAFDRFWRAPNAPHEGSGLGLAIVRHLAAASGGEVALANRIGGGIDASVRFRAG